MTVAPRVLRRDGVALVLAQGDSGVPAIVHWGRDLGPLTDDDVRTLAHAAVPAVPHSSTDTPRWLPVAPGQADGWQGTPALALHRTGRVVHPQWNRGSVSVPDEHSAVTTADEHSTVVTADDTAAGVRWSLTLDMGVGGSVVTTASVTNTGADTLTVDALTTLFPVPEAASEILDTTGRHCRERTPQRSRFDHGTHLRASRRGRTGHDATLLLITGTAGFGFRTGEVWSVHTAWSGNHVHLAERLPERAGQASGVIGGGELLEPGEVLLAPGATYTGPAVHFVYSAEGLDGSASALHRWLRARPTHPSTPRPVVLNTWEGVYFDHDLPRLLRLADAAADVGVERFVLDDGWFRGRRDDTAGLGDWSVDPDIWPNGLTPLFDHVRALGMSPGLWVEPEMVNPNSDLARAHPDWLLSAPGREALLWRGQHVLDLARPDVTEYLLTHLDAVITTEKPSYLKWDHNRDLLSAVTDGGRAGVHSQTTALYGLLGELRARHPGVEIESCASGGARIDLGVLGHTDRVWASDTNDPLERQRIQRWTGQLIPPELVGSHVGPALSHTSGRHSTIQFRCLTALFGHAGMELDVTEVSADDRDVLRRWTALYRRLRGLIHTGDLVRADHPDESVWVHGAVSPEKDHAVFAVVRMDTSPEDRTDRIRFPGLDPSARYRVTYDCEISELGHGIGLPAWMRNGEITLSGAALGYAGLAMPVLYPQTGVLVEASATTQIRRNA